MAGGKRYKFQGSEVRVLIGFEEETGAPAISGITKANPAVVTQASHGRATGDVIRIEDVVGMVEVNDELFVINVLSGSTYELIGVDSSDYAAYASGGHTVVGTMSNFCELTNYNRQGGSSPELPASSLCSDAAEFELGLPDFGTTQMDFNFAPRTAVQGALHEFYESGEKIAVHVVLPNDGGETVQLGFVQQESEQAGVGALWTASTTIRNTGNRVDIEA